MGEVLTWSCPLSPHLALSALDGTGVHEAAVPCLRQLWHYWLHLAGRFLAPQHVRSRSAPRALAACLRLYCGGHATARQPRASQADLRGAPQAVLVLCLWFSQDSQGWGTGAGH